MNYARNILILLPELFQAFWITVNAALASSAMAALGGLLLLIPLRSQVPIFKRLATSYIELLRYTPLLVQIYLLYFGLPLLGVVFSGLACGVIALTLQHAAFFAVVLRSGVDSVKQGQWLAAQAIGLRPTQIWLKVVLPQAIRSVIPPLGNQFVLLAKDTSLLSAVGVAELTLASKMIVERSAATLDVFVAVGLLYLVLTTAIGLIARALEHTTAKTRG
jgi:His/Glu/Gln/Arg/opine family amino acid ABC transporter permease subunit